MHGAAARRVGHTEVPDENRCAILTPPQANRAAEPLRIRERENSRQIPTSLSFIRVGSLWAGHARPLQDT